jgi:hypothetical protein
MKFEFKRLVLFEFEKEKEKRENLTSSPFSPAGPSAHQPPPAAARLPPFFSFFLESLTGWPHPSGPFSFLPRPLPFLYSASADQDTTSSPPPPLPPFHSWASIKSRDPRTCFPSKSFCSPFPFLLYAAVPPAISGKCAGRRPLLRFPFSLSQPV